MICIHKEWGFCLQSSSSISLFWFEYPLWASLALMTLVQIAHSVTSFASEARAQDTYKRAWQWQYFGVRDLGRPYAKIKIILGITSVILARELVSRTPWAVEGKLEDGSCAKKVFLKDNSAKKFDNALNIWWKNN